MVLDTSALMAMLLAETGGDRVRAALPDASMSVVNAAEAAEILVRKGVALERAVERLSALAVKWIEPSFGVAMKAAGLRQLGGLSLGDRFCIALARDRNEPVLTADRVWASLNIGVTVELIR